MTEIKLRNKVNNAVKWSTITELSTKLISPITSMILARLVSPENFGIVATVAMITSFADMFTDAGFQKYLVQHEFKDDSEQKKYTNVAFWTNLFISLILWILIFIFRNSIARSVGNPGLGNVIAIACVQLPLTSFSSIQMALYHRSFNYKTLFKVRLLSTLIPVLVTIPLAFYGLGYWAVIIGSICGVILNAIILTIDSKWKPQRFYDVLILKKMLSFSTWSLIEAISIWLTTWMDVLIIGSVLNQYYLGLYKQSLNIVSVFMSVITSAITPIVFSTLSRLQNDKEEFEMTFLKVQRMVAYVVFPLGLGIFLYSDVLTNILLGAKWSEASDIIGIWALTTALMTIYSHFNSEVFRAKGMPKLSFFIQITHLLVLVPTCLISSKYGFWALIYSRAFVRLELAVVGLIVMQVVIKFNVKNIFKNTLKPLFCTLFMGFIAMFLKQFSGSIIWSLVSILFCIIVYVVSLLLFAKKDIQQIIAMKKDNNLLS